MSYPYPPQQPQYAPQYPPAQPQYPPQQPQYYPPQGYAPPAQYPPQVQQQPLARGTISDFFDQPAASGKSISFDKKPPGTSYAGVVARTLTEADIQQQTSIDRRPLFHPDGRPKFVMIIPLQMQPSAEFPDGRAAWYVKGADKTELERAMEAAGLKPGTVPEAGAVITITYTGDRPIPNLNPQKVKQVTYARPAGAPPVQQQQPQYAPGPNGQAAQDTVTGNGNYPQYAPAPQSPEQAYAQATGQPQPSQAQYAPQYAPQVQQFAPQQFTQPQPGPAPQPAQAYAPPAGQQPAPPAPAAVPQQGPVADLSPEQQQLLRQLTGGQ